MTVRCVVFITLLLMAAPRVVGAQATEKYTNNPVGGVQGRLAGAINASTTTIVVDSAAVFPSSGIFSLLIGTEYLRCTVVVTVTFTCDRGTEGSTAASHTNNSVVSHVLTDRSIRNNPLALTTAGDLPYLNASVAQARLPIGAVGDVLTVAGGMPTWAAPVMPVINVKSPPYNAVGDGTTDDSVAVIAAIAAASTAGGGTVYFPCTPGGYYRIDSQLVIPNDSATPIPNQKNIRLTGCGPAKSFTPYTAVTILDLRYVGTGGKILTTGYGILEIDHLQLGQAGTTSNTTPLLYTTNTILHVHDNSFVGSDNVTQDAIILGGVDFDPGNLLTSPFQGYGTVINNNSFQRLARGVVANTHANSITLTDNSWFNNSGIEEAIHFNGLSGSPNKGAYVAGNLFEMDTYKYAIRLNYTINSTITGNALYDAGGQFVSSYRIGTGSDDNFIQDANSYLMGPVVSGAALSFSNIITDRLAIFAGIQMPTEANKISFVGDATNYYIGNQNVTNGLIGHAYYGWNFRGNSGIGLKITSTSNVGIGTTGSTSPLTVNGNFALTTSTTGAGAVAISATAPTAAGTGMAFTVGTGSTAFDWTVTITTANAQSAFTLTVPTASNAWNCLAQSLTNPGTMKLAMSSRTTTTAVLTQYAQATGAAANYADADVITGTCTAH